jgi:23S rRNA (uracil1939-C5)-methyltransferase
MRLGYFERGSHRVCDVASCAVLVPELETTFESLRTKMKNGDLSDGFTELQAAAGDDGVSLSPGLQEHPTREVSRIIGGHRYRFNAEGFFQINHQLLEQLIAAAIGGAQGGAAVDLYCGVGLFTLPLAKRFQSVHGVEADATALDYARVNLKDEGFVNVVLERANVANWLKEYGEDSPQIDFVVLDPPRTGAEASVIEGIAALRPRQISYVSCDPAILARDLKRLTESGYRIESIAAFDLFPQNHHVETVVRLRPV